MAISDQFVPNITDGSANAAPHAVQTITAAGAITIAQGTVILAGTGTTAITIDDPPATMNGATLHLVCTTAQDHNITYTGGFAEAGAGSDVLNLDDVTESAVLVAYNSVWYLAYNGGSLS